MQTTTDITNVSDTVLDAFLAWTAGDEDFDFDALNKGEMVALAALLPAVDFRTWIATAPIAHTAARGAARAIATGADVAEDRILRAQDAV